MNKESRTVRSRLYLLLSTLFSYPEDNVINKIDLDELIALTEKSHFMKTARLLREMRLGVLLKEDCKLEFTRLFINAYPALPCPPYESVYMSGRHLLMGECVEELRKLYESGGLEVAGELPDNISVELEFMHYLAKLETGLDKEVKEVLRLEKKMLEGHLMKWAFRFAKCIEDNSQQQVYRKAAQLLKTYLEEDNRYLSHISNL